MPAMAPHHEPLKALGPVKWEAVPLDELGDYLKDTFADAQTIVDSIPVPNCVKSAVAGGRARSHTESAVPVSEINQLLSSRRQSAAAMSHAQELSKEWKEVKINAKDNPLGISVYKLAAKDGKGSWFARRSVHDGLTFEKWKLGLEREFAETMKTQTGPGGGNIRGIGAERRIEHRPVDNIGKAEVFQLSAQFPAVTPRDFVTALLTSDATDKTETADGPAPLRQFMVVSKPVTHPKTPARQGFVRGQYESVEVIREVPSEKPAMKRARSSIDLSSEEERKVQAAAERIGREAILRAASKAANGDINDQTTSSGSRARGQSVSSAPFQDESGHGKDEEDNGGSPAIEWVMITRSDPGGSVPRFMVEKGTPGGIVSDAGKFLKWISSKDAADFVSSEDNDFKTEAIEAEERRSNSLELPRNPTANLLPDTPTDQAESVPSSNGLYGMLSGVVGTAANAVANRLPNNPFGNISGTESIPEDDETESDTSSVHSFASAQEGLDNDGVAADSFEGPPDEGGADDSSLKSTTSAQQEKEMKKLQERRRKLQEKIGKIQERMSAKRPDDKEKDTASLARLKERHEREIAKQEEKYQHELRRLERKKEQEEKKAQERRRKAVEREERANVNMELERVRAERDLALNQIEILKTQVGELQAQNTMLVAKLGRMGPKREDSARNGISKLPKEKAQVVS